MWFQKHKRTVCVLGCESTLPPMFAVEKTQEDHLCLWLKKHLITFVYVFERTLKLKRHNSTTTVFVVVPWLSD